MSTTFNGSNPSSNGVDPSAKMNGIQTDSSGIVFFDATLARKERMKQIAAGEAVKNSAAPKVEPAVPVAPATPAIPTPMAPAMSNGHAATPQPMVPQPTTPAVPTPVAATPVAPTAGVKSASGEELSRPELEKFMVNFVVEQTGYPEEMVELDADLEADLGIDSIKKAQMFGELAEHLKVEIEITEDMSLDDYPTLNHIIDFLLNSPAPAATQPAAPVTPATPAVPTPMAPAMSNGHAATPQPMVPQPNTPAVPTPVAATPVAPTAGVKSASGEELSRSELEKFMVNFVVEQTGYPEEMVELDADLEADLGIDSIKKAQMFGELAEHLKVEIEITEDMSLDDYPTLNHIIDFLLNSPAPAATQPVAPAAPAIPTPMAPAISNGHAATPQPMVPQPMVPQAAPVIPVATTPAVPTPVAPTAGVTSASGKELSRPELEKFMVNFVVEQTGYPEEMVELDADLEADLGIDSIKKAQMFGELAEHLKVEIEITEDMSLDDYPTLNHIIDFLMS